MCFSATASFTSGIVLGAAGVVTLKNAQVPSQKMFAAIPLVFAIQQITEGFLWLALKGKIDPSWESIFTYIFITVAQAVWPFWVPLSITLMEPNPKRRKLFFFLSGIGIVLSLSVIYRLLFYSATAVMEEHHIVYRLTFPNSIQYVGIFSYVLVTIGSPFFSSLKHMRLVGALTLISFLVAEFFYTQYVISVWCFFAAIISVAVYVVLRELRKIKPKEHFSNYKISDFQL